ncbi:MAG: hypothetical protein NVV73_14485 [Cellvibrionaceae bacterium]|nr:hypothetical protein [Cellvibrionaceae bacterium]
MIEQAAFLEAPNSSAPPGDFEAFCALYRQRQDALSLIKQLNQMTKAVQRHRGMSMALLAGSNLFQGGFPDFAAPGGATPHLFGSLRSPDGFAICAG